MIKCIPCRSVACYLDILLPLFSHKLSTIWVICDPTSQESYLSAASFLLFIFAIFIGGNLDRLNPTDVGVYFPYFK